MSFFDIFNKQNRQEAKERKLTRQARQRIGVQDFEKKLYIAVDGTPLVPVEPQWTTKDIIERIDNMRSNYVKGRKSESASRGTAVF